MSLEDKLGSAIYRGIKQKKEMQELTKDTIEDDNVEMGIRLNLKELQLLLSILWNSKNHS